MARTDNEECTNHQDATETDSRNQCPDLIQSLDDLSKLEEDTRAFLESSTPFTPSQVNVVSLSEEKIVIEVQLKKSDDDVSQHSEPDQSPPDNKESGSYDESTHNSDMTPEMKDQQENQHNLNHLTVNPNCPRSNRRAVSECADVVTPIRGILKMSRSLVRRTVSESHAGEDDVDDVFVSSPDMSIDGEERAKKCVHFNDRVFMSTFRSNSSILSRKNKTLKRTMRRMKKLSGSESSSDIESHERSSSSTEDLKINDPPQSSSTPTVDKQGQLRKVMVVKPLFENGTIFTVTPVDDSELEEKNNEVMDKSTRPGRQDSGYDSEESREANEENVEEAAQLSWQEVKSKNRRRKSRKPHTDQLRKESRVEREEVDQHMKKGENIVSRTITNDFEHVISA